jgi:hypothetical protein
VTLAWLLWLFGVTDAGVHPLSPPPPPPKVERLSAEDQEVVKELELLENLDESKELEALKELSVER